MYFGTFKEVCPKTVKAKGDLSTFLERQNLGLSSRFTEQGYPFNTPMWNGGVGQIKPASIVYNDECAETPLQDAWWPYEQSAYLLDGLARFGILTEDSEKLELVRKNIRYLVDHPDENGMLGHCYGTSSSEWPMAVFSRAVKFYADALQDDSIKQALIRHYQAISVNTLAVGFRHINNLEGVLAAFAWSGDTSLLEKAEKAYQLHDEYYSLHTEDEFELYRSKLAGDCDYVIHGVSFSESIKLPVLLYLYSGNQKYLADAEKGLKKVLELHEQIPGLPSSNEDFAGRDPLQGYETCVIGDFSWALGYFLMASGKGEYADRMEKIFYNAFPGSILKDFTGLQYLSAPNQVIAGPGSNHSFFFRGCATFRQFRADHSAQCCTGNVHRILPNYILRMWMLNTDGAPVATLYGPSVYNGYFHEVKYSIREETGYPYSDTISFRFSCPHELQMPFSIRIPHWCAHPQLTLNGKEIAMPEEINGFCCLNRAWNDRDELRLVLPMEAVCVKDRYWNHFEYGPLVFSYSIPSYFKREFDHPLAPCLVTPAGEWNFAVSEKAAVCVEKTKIDGSPLENPPIRLKVSAVPVSGFDELELGRYTPEVPLFHHPTGEAMTLELVPYASTLLRISAFPDLVERTALNCHQMMVSPVYPYDFHKPTGEQRFLPELISVEQIPSFFKEIFPERSGYCDLLKYFGPRENGIAYVIFRFYSDCRRKAVAAVGASDGGEFFFHGKKRGEIHLLSDAEYLAPELFEIELEPGYNSLMVKTAEGPTPMQYRHAWGARVQVFYVDEQGTKKKSLHEQFTK